MFRARIPLHRPGSSPQDLPLEPDARRSRLRRGGPRTPIPLLPIIAVAAGIGVAYVSQSAHATKSGYELTTLQGDQQQLVSLDQQLGEELARLESSERIVAAAQQMGMRPANKWAYVTTRPVQVWPAAATAEAGDTTNSSTLQQLIGALSGSAPGGGHS